MAPCFVASSLSSNSEPSSLNLARRPSKGSLVIFTPMMKLRAHVTGASRPSTDVVPPA